MIHSRYHQFVSSAPRWDDLESGGLAFGDRAGALRAEPASGLRQSRSSTGPDCPYCGAPSCACEDRFTFEYLTDGDRA